MKPDIAYLAQFLKQSSGLIIAEDKTYLIESRLNPIAAKHGASCTAELIEKLKAFPSADMKRDVVEAMTTNETSFFRDGTPFDAMRTKVLPSLTAAGQKKVRIWCAASSTGQEPYSLAILAREMQATIPGLAVEIQATDIDSAVLKRAESGMYSKFEVQRGLPITMLVKYFDQLGPDSWKVKPEIRQMVTFRQANLLAKQPPMGAFDIIFCRNVLIYFDPPTKASVLSELARHLNPRGYLFLGGAETVLSITDRFALIEGMRGVYAPAMKAVAA
jgi:chemotaxis protein methyltransferase CheR